MTSVRASAGCGKRSSQACSIRRGAVAVGAYSVSPTIAWPIAARCTRNWCERPVTGSSCKRVVFAAASRDSTRQRVSDGLPLS